MADKPQLPDGPWEWSRLGKSHILVTEKDVTQVVLVATNDRLNTRGENWQWVDLTPEMPLARAIASIPEMMAGITHILTRAQTDPDFAYHLCPFTESFRLLCLAEATWTGDEIENIREHRSQWHGQRQRAREADLLNLRDMVGQLINEWDSIGSPSHDEEELKDAIREQYNKTR